MEASCEVMQTLLVNFKGKSKGISEGEKEAAPGIPWWAFDGTGM